MTSSLPRSQSNDPIPLFDTKHPDKNPGPHGNRQFGLHPSESVLSSSLKTLEKLKNRLRGSITHKEIIVQPLRASSHVNAVDAGSGVSTLASQFAHLMRANKQLTERVSVLEMQMRIVGDGTSPASASNRLVSVSEKSVPPKESTTAPRKFPKCTGKNVVLICGELRKLQGMRSWKSTRDMIIKPNNADVVLAVWTNVAKEHRSFAEFSSTQLTEALDFFKPCAV